jgi:hypothetical protein
MRSTMLAIRRRCTNASRRPEQGTVLHSDHGMGKVGAAVDTAMVS